MPGGPKIDICLNLFRNKFFVGLNALPRFWNFAYNGKFWGSTAGRIWSLTCFLQIWGSTFFWIQVILTAFDTIQTVYYTCICLCSFSLELSRCSWLITIKSWGQNMSYNLLSPCMCETEEKFKVGCSWEWRVLAVSGNRELYPHIWK